MKAQSNFFLRLCLVAGSLLLPDGGQAQTTLQNGVAVTGLSGAAKSERHYKVAVPSGQSSLQISIAGGSGDCDLYVKKGSAPTTASYDYRPYKAGNNESVSVANPAAADWFIMLRGTVAYSGVTLLASHKPGAAVATPTFSPNGGSFSGSVSVTIACSTAGATIRYTTDGRDPTASSTAYTKPVVLTSTTTLKARAFKTGMSDSAAASATFTRIVPVSTPTFSPNGGSFDGSASVTVACSTAGATIRYTTDGRDPTASSTAYTKPVVLTSTTTLKARAFKSGMADSAVASATFTKLPPPTLTGVVLQDAADKTRSSSAKLQMVRDGKTSLNAVLTASSDRPLPAGQPSWTANGKSIGTGTPLTASFSTGPSTVTYTVAGTAGTVQKSATLEIQNPATTTLVFLDLKSKNIFTDVLKTLNQTFGQNENQFSATLKGVYKEYYVNQTRSPNIQLSKEWTATGGASMEYKAFVPGWSVTIPYCRAGVFVSPKVTLGTEFSVLYDGRKNPVDYTFSGGPTASGSIGGGLGMYVGERNVIRIDADVQGSVGVLGTGKLQGPPPAVNLKVTVGQLKASGQVKVTLIGQPIVTYQTEVKVWDGITLEKTLPLSKPS
jgi:hypothetical protein